YFIPGVDKENYGDAISFLKARGYSEFLEAIGMDALIGQFQWSADLEEKRRRLAEAGIEIGPLRIERLTAFLEFMEETMPGDWAEAARELLRKIADSVETFDRIQIASDRGKIVGYCQFDGEHFGPFGVAETHQGKG